MKTGQRKFARRDAADLFTASALVNDKDGKLTERERSLSSAFLSREGHEDSGSEDAEVNHRANRSVTVSGPLRSDRSVGSESDTDRDSTVFLGDYATEDLDLVENAILRLLREDGRSSSKPHNDDSTKLKDALGLDERLEGSEQTQSSAGSVDLQLLSRLLDQVQTLREQKYQYRQAGRAARSLSRGRSVWDVTKRGGKEKRISKDDMKKAVEAATQAAKSAAEAAKNASSLVTKNSEVVGKLLQSLNPSASEATSKKQENKTSSDNPDHYESLSDSEESSDSDDMKAIAKRIVSQNRYTHVVLGIMLVSSFVWRYVVVKVVKRVKNKVSDPWGYVGGMLTDNFKGPEKEKEKEKGKADSGEEHSSGLNMPQLNLPPLLNGERSQGKETSTSEVKEEHVKEERSLSFGNIIQSKSNSSKVIAVADTSSETAIQGISTRDWPSELVYRIGASKFERLNKYLIENQKVYQQRIKEFEERELKSVKETDDVSDLEEQVRDFLLFIEAQKVLGTSSNGAKLRSLNCLPLLHPAIRALVMYVWERRNDKPLLQQF